MSDHISPGGPKFQKACDSCKIRKVKCSGAPGPCKTCTVRQTECHFRQKKLPKRKNVAVQLLPSVAAPQTPLPVSLTSRVKTNEQDTTTATLIAPQELYIDRLLAQTISPDHRRDSRPFAIKGNGLFGGNGNYRLSFFSDSRLHSLSTRLRNGKVNALVQRISNVINGRIVPRNSVAATSMKLKAEVVQPFTDRVVAARWIDVYFEHAHPVTPFLDRKSFEAIASSPQLPEILAQDKPWSVLYHAVLALGCQYAGGGGFEPGRGQSWSIFSISLSLFPDLLTLPDSLTAVKAMTAMAVYAMSISCLAIEHVITSEAARRAQNLASNNLTGSSAVEFQRTFWVLYSIEKFSSFLFGRSSVFVDGDISCPIPHIPEAVYGDFDWFLSFARFARLLSRAGTSLFSTGVTGSPKSYYLSTIEQLYGALEIWRSSVPEELRPGVRRKGNVVVLPPSATSRASKQVLLWTQYLYHCFVLVLARATLQVGATEEGLVSPAWRDDCTRRIMDSSRSVLELTVFIEVEPYTSLWLMAGIPILALFALFDLVVHNPRHPETSSNLALLDMAGGHFSRMEFVSAGSLPGSLISEFAHIAREYVNEVGRGDNSAERSIRKGNTMPPDNDGGGGGPVDTDDSGEKAMGLINSPTRNRRPGLHPMTAMSNGSVYVQGPNTEVGPVDQLQVDSSFGVPTTGTPVTPGPLCFPIINDESLEMDDGILMGGTDVMDLFNYFIPGINPLFGQGDIE